MSRFTGPELIGSILPRVLERLAAEKKVTCGDCGRSFGSRSGRSRRCLKCKVANNHRLYRRRLAHPIRRAVRDALLLRSGGYCECCDAPFTERGRRALEIDHIIPLDAGGTSAIENLQAICCACNRSKGKQVAGGGKREESVKVL